MSKYPGQFFLPHLPLYTPPRINDFFLMDKVLASDISRDHVNIFNHVRMYLNIITASDIVSLGSGACIMSTARNGTLKRRSKLGWPNSSEPPKRWMEIWCNILDDVILPCLLQHPLGNWVSQSHQLWDHFTNAELSIISTGATSLSRRRSTRFASYDLMNEYSPMLIPCDVTVVNTSCLQYLGSGSMTITTRQRKPKTFRAKFKNVKDWRRRNWGWTKMDNKLVKKTVRLLRQDNLVCCSDRSVNFGRAAHRGTAPVDGPASALN